MMRGALCLPDAQADDSVWGRDHVVFYGTNSSGTEAIAQCGSVLVILGKSTLAKAEEFLT